MATQLLSCTHACCFLSHWRRSKGPPAWSGGSRHHRRARRQRGDAPPPMQHISEAIRVGRDPDNSEHRIPCSTYVQNAHETSTLAESGMRASCGQRRASMRACGTKGGQHARSRTQAGADLSTRRIQVPRKLAALGPTRRVGVPEGAAHAAQTAALCAQATCAGKNRGTGVARHHLWL